MSLKNTKHELFALNLAKGMTADAAYEAAGYKPSRAAASRLSTKVNIRERVEELRSRIVERTIEKTAVSKEWVVEQLVRVYKESMDGQPVKDRYGNATDKVMPNYSAANRALELLGKEEGMFVERRDVSITTNPWSEIIELTGGKKRHLEDHDEHPSGSGSVH